VPRRRSRHGSPHRQNERERRSALQIRVQPIAGRRPRGAPAPSRSGWLTATPIDEGTPPIVGDGSVPPGPARPLARSVPQGRESGADRGRGGLFGRLGHLSGLDGLRAIAVVAVLLYHSDLDFLPGGFLGVDVFFVISGYLITALLLREFADRGTFSLRGFWFRRARRLLPAVFVLLAGVVVFALVALPDEVARLRSDVAAALTYITNWYLIFHQQSYFDAVGRPSPLGHLWSLAVEEQFYLLWPPILLGLLFALRRHGALIVTLLLAWASAIWMALLYDPNVDPSRVYFGTDTRAFALLVGAALAFVWVPVASGAHPARSWRRPRITGSDAVAAAGLAGLGFLFFNLTAYDDLLYLGGFQFTAILTAIVIAAVVRPAGLVGRLLDTAPMRWLGHRSYSIYLWHWPVFVVTRPGIDIALEGWPALALRLAATLVLADLSFRFIERPIREGALGRAWARWTKRQRSFGRDPRWSAVPAGLFVGILLAAVGVQVLVATPAPVPSYLVGTEPASVSESDPNGARHGDTAMVPSATDDLGAYDPGDPNVDPNLDVTDDEASGPDDGSPDVDVAATDPDDEDPAADETAAPAAGASLEPTPAPTPQPTRAPIGSARPAGSAAPVPATASPVPATASPVPATSASPEPSTAPSRIPAAASAKPGPKATPAEAVKPTARPTPKVVGKVRGRVLAIGDSVMLGATRALRRQFTSIEVNAAVSRQFNDGIRILRARAAAGTLPDVVVIHLGTNGPISKRQFDLAMSAAKDVRLVVFVNVKVPRPWESYTNRTLSQNVKRYDNAILVNWHDASEDVTNALAGDGIHLNSAGASAYARLIAAAVR
jgi:peptidoglycan/LPS O-acetylase OafA/YrhL